MVIPGPLTPCTATFTGASVKKNGPYQFWAI